MFKHIVWSSGMMKIFAISLLFIAFVATTFAAEDRVDMARFERDHTFWGNKVLPPVVTEKYEYYEVCGSCEETLHCDLKQKCVTWKDGHKYDSLTSWDVKWDHEYDRTSDTCAVNSFKPIVEITFRYPKWKRTDDAPLPLIRKWDRYIDNLVAHENGHRDLVVEAANDLSHAVAQLPPAATCAALERAVRALCRKRLEKMHTDQREYDETTKHGALKGALFP